MSGITYNEDDDVAQIWALIQAQEALSLSNPPRATPTDNEVTKRLALERGTTSQISQISSPSNNKSMTTASTGSTSSDSAPSPYRAKYDLSSDPLEAISALSKHLTQARSCVKCGGNIPSRRKFVVFGAVLPPPPLLYVLHAQCGACGTVFCRGCSRVLPCQRECKGKSCVFTCCADVRAIALFEALSVLDRSYVVVRADRTNKMAAMSMGTFQRAAATQTTGMGGTGYSVTNTPQAQPKPERSALAPPTGIGSNVTITRALDLILQLLPDPSSNREFDMFPNPAMLPLLQLSYLPELLRELLRNDSVEEWTRQSQIYEQMIELLKRLANSKLCSTLLTAGTWEKKSSPGIDAFVWGDGRIELEVIAPSGDPPTGSASQDSAASQPKTYSRGTPLYDDFTKLLRLCDAFVSLTSREDRRGDDDMDAQTLKGRALCSALIQANKEISRSLENGVQGSGLANDSQTASTLKGKQKQVDPKASAEQAYVEACDKLCFAHVSMSSRGRVGGLVYPDHLFNQSLKDTASSTRIPAQRLHLIRELAGMATSLPPGIWIRVDDVRNDALKIMIAGPEGTPYAGGLYEFDCFLPLNYPAVSPQVKLRTTGGGTVRFNPNLYNDGKVCLSLLGTWPGQPEEMWQPNKSTLLQVLISIQSMIMIETPYFNEPGFGQADPNNPSSIAYNKNIALQNVRWAMVDWMKDEHKKGLWAEIIASHFSIRKDIIREQIVAWAAQDSTFKNYPFPRVSRDERDLLKAFDSGAKLVQGWKPRK